MAAGHGQDRRLMATWDDVRRRLDQELAELGDEEFVLVGEPVGPPGPPRGLLRRRSSPAPTRYAQVVRRGDHWYAECVGATSFGGDWEVGPAAHARLLALGWLAPGDDDPSGMQPSYPNYWRVLARPERAQVATMCVDALAALGADADVLEWRRP